MNSCKAQNVSPFAAFQAAVLVISNDKLSLPKKFKLKIPVNIRPYYSKLQHDYIYQQVANYVTFLPCEIKIPVVTSGFWPLAKYCKHVVHDNLVTRVDKSLQVFSVFRSISADVLASKPHGVAYLVLFNNLGNRSFLDRRDDCPVRVIATYGCVPQHKSSTPLFAAHCMYLEKRFICSLSYSAKRINERTVLHLSENIKQKIINEINSKKLLI